MNKKQWFRGIVLVIALMMLIIGTLNWHQGNKKNTSFVVTEVGNLKKIPNQIVNQKKISFKKVKWSENIPENSRFILISSSEKLTTSEKINIQGFLREKKVVLFYGENVNAKKALQKMNVKVPPVQIAGDTKIYYILYGYGYSNMYKKDMILFFGANEISKVTPHELASFLKKHQNF